MARPTRCRRICVEPAYDSFRPEGIPTGERIHMTVDEYEAIRLIDLEKRTHEQCAEQMGISRTTVTEIYETARYKLADCVVNGKTLHISGGNYRLCDGMDVFCCGKRCRRPEFSDMQLSIRGKGEGQMRIGVTYENGEIFQHFGHTEAFKIYDIADDKVVSAEVVDTNGSGHGALAGFLVAHGVDTLICGGIGGGAQNALAQAGIRLFGGVSGNADEAVNALLAGNLGYDPDVHCNHHDHHGEGHSCGDHACGNHGA